MKRVKEEYRELPGEKLAQVCAKAALDTRAQDLVILDVRELTTFTEYFVIMSGTSSRHVQALAEAVEGTLRSKKVSATRAEGLQDGMWVLLDYDDVVVHIFYHDRRPFYDLEGLWADAKQVTPEC